MGMVRQWMVAGPFEARSLEGALTDVVQPNEAVLQPAAGQSIGGKPWKPFEISVANHSQDFRRLGIDFALLYGREKLQGWQNKASTMEPLVAYAATYVYSAEAGKLLLRVEGTNTQTWLNGIPVKKPGENDASPAVDLVQGWNRLTIKAAAGKMNWYATAQFFPLPGTPYETKNIVWMAPMPGPSWSSPIIVGPKLFVNADAGTLVCLNKATGQVLWTRSTTYYHALPAADRAKYPDAAPKAQQLDQLMMALPADLNAGLSPDGSRADGNAALHAKIKQKIELERTIQNLMSGSDKVFRSWDNDRGTSTPTPVSDGKFVYGAFYGGNKGIGANVIVCYDLEGRSIWSHFTGQTGIGEHGTHSTPVLSGKYLVYMSGGTLFCYDKLTGNVEWKKKTPFGGCTGASLIAGKAGGVDVVLVPSLGIYRTADGAELWKSDVPNDLQTPCSLDGMVFGVSGGRGVAQEGAMAYAFHLSDAGKPEFLMKVPWKGIGLDMAHLPDGATYYGNTLIGSPLVHDGLAYVVSEGGALTVVDLQARKAAYTKALDGLSPRLTWVFVVGICTGPTLAGKNIHIRDDQSQTLVIAPGREYKELARNVLWEASQGGSAQESAQQESQSNPIYEDARMYYRTQGYLYCIGEK
jgi:outer membrane protein assembly factor BamB